MPELAALAELRELEWKRHARDLNPEADPAADDDIDRRTREVMDHFRDLPSRSRE